MKLSICIPVHSDHVKYLDDIVSQINSDKLVSHEIIFSGKLGDWEPILSDIPVIRLNYEFNQTAGFNRNRCIESSSGDIIVFQDADDTCHPGRYSYISSYFGGLDVLFSVVSNSRGNGLIGISDVHRSYIMWNSVSIRRGVKLRFDDNIGEDRRFGMLCIENHRCGIIDEVLVKYRIKN